MPDAAPPSKSAPQRAMEKLGLLRDIPEERVRTSLTFLTTPAASGLAPKGALDGLRFEAEDVDWHHGSGPIVTGGAAALLLALTGRPAGLKQLSGDGVQTGS